MKSASGLFVLSSKLAVHRNRYKYYYFPRVIIVFSSENFQPSEKTSRSRELVCFVSKVPRMLHAVEILKYKNYF